MEWLLSHFFLTIAFQMRNTPFSKGIFLVGGWTDEINHCLEESISLCGLPGEPGVLALISASLLHV